MATLPVLICSRLQYEVKYQLESNVNNIHNLSIFILHFTRSINNSSVTILFCKYAVLSNICFANDGKYESILMMIIIN